MTTLLTNRALTSALNRFKLRAGLAASLCLLTIACTSQSAATQSAPAVPKPPQQTPESISDKADSPNPSSELLAESSVNSSNQAQNDSEALNVVPPGGLDSLDEVGFSYFQQMGPLEYAARLGGIPGTAAWRVRLRLYPQSTETEQTYLVKLDHYNLSPALYRELVSSYGDNTDPSLVEAVSHRNFELTFFPVMGTAAEWLSEETQISDAVMTENPPCGVDLKCAELRSAPVMDTAIANTVTLEPAPWETTQATEQVPDSALLYSLVRALAIQAGWRQEIGAANIWTAKEMPEGLSRDRPWVEIVVDNYIGNGSGYSAEWIELAADDSIRQVVHQVVYDGRGETALAETKFVCARGAGAGQLLSICP